MRTGRNLSHRPGAGGHNNRPTHPYDIRVEHSRDRKGCLPGIMLLLVLILAGALASAYFFAPWWVESQIEHYTPFSNQALAGTIKNIKTGTNNTSQLLLSTPVEGGTMIAAPPYLLHCNVWRLHADILTTPSWMNMQSHTWYQLTSIEGSQCRDQHGKVVSHIDINIVGSNDSFGENVRRGEGFGMVIAKEITSNFMPVVGKTYKVIITPTSLLLTPTS